MDRRKFLLSIGAGAVTGTGTLVRAPTIWAAAAPVDDVARPPTYYAKLFNTREIFIGTPRKRLPRARVLSTPLKQPVAARMAHDLRRTVPAAGPHWRDVLAGLRTLDPMRRLELVNDYANRMPYIEDLRNFGLRDYWAEVDTFFKIGGDCEDFAIAKFKLLKEVGFHRDRMRIVLLVDTRRNRQHAVLAVYMDERALMLDSLIATVVEHSSAAHYRPTVSLTASRLYLHATAKQPTV